MATATKARKASKVTKVEANPDRTAFTSVVNSLSSNVKKGVVEDLQNLHVDVIPTGMLGLDIATGVGGFPVGRIVELYGMESCGKSTVLYHLIAQAQRLNYLPIIIETEGSIDTRYMRRIGMKITPDDLMVFSPDTMESAINFIEESCNKAHEAGLRALLLLDSVASLAPEVVMDDSADKKFRAVAAAVWSQQMPKMTHLLRRTDSTLILVNQMREGMDLYNPPSTPGGKAIKFAASMRVLMRRKVDKDKDKGSLSGSFGQEIFFTIEKNKMSSPHRKGMCYLPAGKGVDLAQDVMARGIERGLIEANVKYEDGELIKKNNWFTIVPDDQTGEAIVKDIARARAAGKALPGTKAGIHLNPDEPFSMYYEKTVMEVLDMAPNLTAALKARILETLKAEANFVDEEDPFAARLRLAEKEFDIGAEDGLTNEEHEAAALLAAEGEDDDSNEDDDLAEFDNSK